MAIREIIRIDEDKCDGCGDCVVSCEEGAIQIIDGKAKVISEVYCDGLGACIGACPQGALTIEKREAPDLHEAPVIKHLAKAASPGFPPLPLNPGMGGCPGSAARTFTPPIGDVSNIPLADIPSQLGQWPVQLMLVPPHAPFLQRSDLLICADCVPFTVPDFHTRYLRGRAVLVGCPKLDDIEFYQQKLKAIFAEAMPRRITVLRMEVPCCGGIADAAVNARAKSGHDVPLEVHTIGIQGGVHEQTVPMGGGRFEL